MYNSLCSILSVLRNYLYRIWWTVAPSLFSISANDSIHLSFIIKFYFLLYLVRYQKTNIRRMKWQLSTHSTCTILYQSLIKLLQWNDFYRSSFCLLTKIFISRPANLHLYTHREFKVESAKFCRYTNRVILSKRNSYWHESNSESSRSHDSLKVR
jgi:hypothetical protein